MFSAVRSSSVSSDEMRVVRGIPVALKFVCFAVGVCHLLVIGCSLYEKIWELVKLEEPFLIQDHTVILVSHTTQILSVILLLFASATGKSYCAIPWLVSTALLFSSGTVYAFLYATKEETSQTLLNFAVVGLIWSSWYGVIKFYLQSRIMFCVSLVAMSFLNDFLYLKEKNRIYLVGILHCVMVLVGMCSLVLEMIDLEEPVTTYDLVYTAVHYSVHIILIACLFLGTYIDIPFIIIPWLSATFFVYLYVTVLTLTSLENRKMYDVLVHLMNFAYLGICWYTWYVVFSYVRDSYRRVRMCQNKHLIE